MRRGTLVGIGTYITGWKDRSPSHGPERSNPLKWLPGFSAGVKKARAWQTTDL